MKIAQITECLTDNGVSTVIRNLTKGFREAGHQVDIITWCTSADEDPGLRQFSIEGLSQPPTGLQRLLLFLLGQRLWCYFRSAHFSFQLQKQIDLDDYDAILLHGLACIPLWRLPSRVFIVAHSTKSKMLLRARQSLFKPIFRRLYSRMYQAHPVICVSQGAREDMINIFEVDADNVTAIYNPFPLEEIRQKALEPIDDVPDSYLLAVGRPVKSKRFDRLMRVYKMSGIEAPLVIMVGTGKVAKIKNLAERHGIKDRVKVIGFRSNPYPYMAKARLLALTSDYEGLPTVLIESLACGTPVVSTDCPSGPREILTDIQIDGLVDITDEISFSKKIATLFMQQKNIEFSGLEKFSLKNSISQYLKCITADRKQETTNQ